MSTIKDKEAVEKLNSSGLTVKDAENLGIEFLTAGEVSVLDPSFKKLKSLRLNYFDPREPSKPLTAFPMHPPFFRLRYLEEEKNNFGAIPAGKPLRYVQPSDSGVAAYFPRIVKWPEIIKNVNDPIIITEGEFKAAKACKEGFYTVGLGGVYNFKSTEHGITFLPELEIINWAQRYTYIAYDSDFRKNLQVVKAINDLARQLMRRGAYVRLVEIVDVPGLKKTGLDDLLVAEGYGPSALKRFLTQAVPLTMSETLWRINNEITYITDPGVVVIRDTDQMLQPAKFREASRYATYEVIENVIGPGGIIVAKPTSAAEVWLKWPYRREARTLIYRPGRPRDYDGDYNVWPGWGVTPREGNVKPFLALIDHLFKGSNPDYLRWFLDWLAYPLQNPGVKMFTAALLYGIRHGTGKSLIGNTMGRIYGKNFTELNQNDLHAGFNSWANNKQFVMGDDVTGSDRRADADMLKKLITQRQLRINEKYLPTYVIDDVINYYFTSNQPDAFFLEDDDRRFFIHEVIVPPLDDVFYDRYAAWLDDGGAEYLFYYFLKRPLNQFNPAAAAPKTEARERMVADVKSDIDDWAARLRQDTDGTLRIDKIPILGDLFTNTYLLTVYQAARGDYRVTANGLGRALKRAGFRQVNNGKSIRSKHGVYRLYAIRNEARWIKATPEQLTIYIDKQEKL
jgi:hypothetical protein